MKSKINLLLKYTFIVFLGTAFTVNAQTAKQIKQDRKIYNKNYKKVQKVYAKAAKENEKEEESNGPELERKTPEAFFALDYVKTMDVQTGKQHPQSLILGDKDIRKGKYDPIGETTMKLVPSGKAGLNSKVDITNQWTERGPYKVGGRTRALMFDPNDPTGKKVFAGGVSGGLWYNNDITDANSEWTPVSNLWANMTISCITSDPNNPQIFYVGTGESYTDQAMGSGIWKTADGGTTWNQIFIKPKVYSVTDKVDGNFFINDIKVRKVGTTSEVYVAVGNGTSSYDQLFPYLGLNEMGLYKSTDAGATFNIITVVSGKDVSPNSIFIAQNNDIYLGTTRSMYGDDTGGKIFKSTNGATFTETYSVGNTSARVQVVGSSTNSQVVYGLMQGTGSGNSTTNNDIVRFVSTNDGGTTWKTSWNTSPALTVPKNNESDATALYDFTRGQSFYDLVVAVDPTNDSKVYVGGIDYHVSTDGGETWNPITKWHEDASAFTDPSSVNLPVVHSDHHAIVFNSKNAANMLFGCDGGIYFVPDRAAAASSTWATIRNNRYNVTQYYHGQLNPSKTVADEEILAGAQDNGTQRFAGAVTTQGTLTTTYADTAFSGGDGGWVGFDDQNLYKTAAYTNNNIYLTNNNGLANGKIFLDPDKGTGHFINEYAIDRNLDILYSYKNDNPNITLFRVKNLNSATPDGDPSVVLQSSIVKEEISLGTAVSGETLSMIVASPYTTASTTLFVGTSKNRLLKVTNANTTPSVTAITNPFVGNISDIEFGANENQILVTVSNFNTVSVYYTADGGTTWTNKEGNLIDIPVRCAFINPDNPKEVILGTELGIFGTTNFDAASPTWAVYNNGIGNLRITNLDYRASDKTLLATTFGRGIFTTTNTSVTLATSEGVKANQNSIYPNPATDGVFSIKTNESKSLQVTIFDVSGKLVYKANNVTSGKSVNSNLPIGVYVVKVNNGTTDILTTKLIVK